LTPPSALALIEIGFDPFLRLGELAVRWQTIGITFALLAALALAALVAERRMLRLGDMVLIVAAIVPGAVIGGRLVHALAFLDAYAAQPIKVLDPSVGSLSLLGAVLGGLISGAYVARLLGAPVKRWADVGAVPMLVAIGLGKIAQFLGGSGQGMPFDGPWAVAFVGSGPWVSANPDLPAHPSQIYESLWVLLGIPLVLFLARARRSRPADDGSLFVSALAWFLIGRLLVGLTWRDDPTVGALNSEQAIALTVLVGLFIRSRVKADREDPLPAP
jgi:phosphatidylglycerol:prolipoprotein diacylglycerol transferase